MVPHGLSGLVAYMGRGTLDGARVGPVFDGPCKGAKNIIAGYGWDGVVGDHPGKYVWDQRTESWVWMPRPKVSTKTRDFIRQRISEAQFNQNRPRAKASDFS